MFTDINENARKVLSEGTVIVDIMIESEATRVMVVKGEESYYFLRFMNGNCYACTTLEDCEKLPIRTLYNSKNDCRYTMVGFKERELKTLNSSNDVKYLIDSNKWQTSYYDSLCVRDNMSGDYVASIDKQQSVVYSLPSNTVKEFSTALVGICKEMGIERSNQACKVSYENSKAILRKGSTTVDLSTFSSMFDLDLAFLNFKNLLRSNIECVVFVPKKLYLGLSQGYYKDSKNDIGKVRVLLGV